MIDTHKVYRWHVDPSGTSIRYEAKAIGAGSEGAQTDLQEQYHKVLLCHYISTAF